MLDTHRQLGDESLPQCSTGTSYGDSFDRPHDGLSLLTSTLHLSRDLMTEMKNCKQFAILSTNT